MASTHLRVSVVSMKSDLLVWCGAFVGLMASGCGGNSSGGSFGEGGPGDSSQPPGTSGSEGSTGGDGSDTGTTGSATDGPGTSTTDAPDDSTSGGGGGPKLDVAGDTEEPPADCTPCAITVESRQSGALEDQGASLLGTVVLDSRFVYGLGTYGAGRYIATADNRLVYREQTDCPLHQWLTQTPDPAPSILMFGLGRFERVYHVIPEDNLTESSIHLPDAYVGDPARLAQDFDLVIYFEGSAQYDEDDEPTDAEVQTVLDYVRVHGGGLYIVSEFADAGTRVYLDPGDLASVNRFLTPLGLESLQLNLDWGDAEGSIQFDCFPPVG